MLKISKTDLFIIAKLCLVLLFYNYTENLAPAVYLYTIQLGILWFFLRIIFSIYPLSVLYICFSILGLGLIEGLWGLAQLYNFTPSNHSLFSTTGSFYNPGPYGGFIALILPLAIHCWLIYKRKNKVLSYFAFLVGIICLLVLPATLSRTAWGAAIAGCLFVIIYNTPILSNISILVNRYRKRFIIYTSIFILFLCIGAYSVYMIKKDSANGRLFMWKITAQAIKESPIQGVGIGGFPSAYAKAQIEYFKEGKGSESEKMVAGSPEYAFNEYLQIFLEQGLFGIILFLLTTFYIIRAGLKNWQIGAVGSFIALSVFAFASYPYRLWEFPILWIVLGAICASNIKVLDENISKSVFSLKRKITRFSFLAILLGISALCFSKQFRYHKARKEWRELKMLYTNNIYKAAAEEYERLYSLLNYEPKFLFEYAKALNSLGEREKADMILERGLKVSSDPMFLNLKGRNYHEMQEYAKAKECYIGSTDLLPGRIYPYYLLTKLYADSANYQQEKLNQAANAVLTIKPKVQSRAIIEMRREVEKILQQNRIEDGEKQ